MNFKIYLPKLKANKFKIKKSWRILLKRNWQEIKSLLIK